MIAPEANNGGAAIIVNQGEIDFMGFIDWNSKDSGLH